MPDDFTFRAPRESDLPAIEGLEAESFASPWKAEFFASELGIAGRFNLVIETGDGRLIGYLFTMHFLDELHVNKIGVDPGSRRFGLATRLMERCITFAEENGIRSITLEVRESNVAARGLYRALGFEEAYVRPRYYSEGESAVVMLKQVEGRSSELESDG